MAGSILGTAVRRVEDPELLTGRGTFVGNLALPGMLHLAFVRSPMAHAELGAIDTAEARAVPGVVGVFTAADLDLPAHHGFITVNPETPRPPLATDRVRFVGEAVAVVVAEDPGAAADAASLVEVDYEPLDAVVDVEEAVAPGAPLQFPGLGSNVATGQRAQDGDDPLAGADVVVRARIVNQRIAVVPMEGNAIAVEPGPEGRLTIWVSTQMPHGFRGQLAQILDLREDDIRVIAPHVGGAFGGKAGVIAEHTVAIGVARALGRPVRWADTRSENLVSMPHGRGQVAWYEMGLRRDGRVTGLRARVLGDAGAYSGFGGILAVGPTYTMAQGVYDFPVVAYDAAAVVTNTTPMGAFRGAGRPEAAAHLERMMDLAAAELGMDPVEVRRRNLLAPDRFPFRTSSGVTYDVGDYDLPLREALRIADYDGLRAQQAARRAAGDPVDTAPVDAYEVPSRLRSALRLRDLAEVFPYGTCTTAGLDADHTQPYLPMPRGGPPGQTGLHNLAPLTRSHHRAVTFAGWRRRLPAATGGRVAAEWRPSGGRVAAEWRPSGGRVAAGG